MGDAVQGTAGPDQYVKESPSWSGTTHYNSPVLNTRWSTFSTYQTTSPAGTTTRKEVVSPVLTLFN